MLQCVLQCGGAGGRGGRSGAWRPHCSARRPRLHTMPQLLLLLLLLLLPLLPVLWSARVAVREAPRVQISSQVAPPTSRSHVRLSTTYRFPTSFLEHMLCHYVSLTRINLKNFIKLDNFYFFEDKFYCAKILQISQGNVFYTHQYFQNILQKQMRWHIILMNTFGLLHHSFSLNELAIFVNRFFEIQKPKPLGRYLLNKCFHFHH